MKDSTHIQRKKRSITEFISVRNLAFGLSGLIIIITGIYTALRCRPELITEYDAAYRPGSELKSNSWYWCQTPAGICYNLFIPEECDVEKTDIRIPLVVVFHGSTEKGISKDRYGRIFTNADAQKIFGPHGAAVLVPHARVEYFSDPHAYSRLIQNVVMKHTCIDKDRIAGYGFSQGAAFVQELAMYDCRLFRAVATGSSYYSASLMEIFKAARVRFYCALSKNDKGIYEQGLASAKALALLCPDSRYVEYETRGHFYIELKDKSGRGDETFAQWLSQALR